MSHIVTAPHEAEGHLIFQKHGLSPYWATSKLLHQGFDGHSGKVDCEYRDDPWHVELAYSDSVIAPRPDMGINRSSMYEYEVHCEGPGELKAHFNISPRFEGMQHSEKGESLSIPWQPGGDGIDVDFHGSNIEPEQYPEVLRMAFRALADKAGVMVRRDYFTELHESSNLYTYERYVRLSRDMSQKLVRSSGMFYRIFHLLSSEEGAKWVFAGDNEEIVGKNHRLKLWPEAVAKLMPMNSRGKQLKSYHPKYVRREETDGDALSSPKFGVLLKKRFNPGSFAWSELNDLRREIEETVVNVLGWAGIPTQPDSTTFVEDDHFTPRASNVDIERHPDPTPELEAKQDALIMTVLRDLTDSAEAVVDEISKDGGKHVRELADETGYSLSSIYRALQQLGELMTNDNGLVELASEKLRQEVRAIVESTEYNLKNAADRAAKLVNLEMRQAADSALQQWLSKYGVEFSRVADGSTGRLRIDTVLSTIKSGPNPMLTEVLSEGLDAWCRVGRDPALFEQLRWEAEVINGQGVGKVARILR